jgi:hypothetical protein
MDIDKKIIEIINELITMGEKVVSTRKFGRYSGDSDRVDQGLASQWITRIQSLMQKIFGDNSVYYNNIKTLAGDYLTATYGSSNQILGILRAAKDDYEHGYLFDIKKLIEAEIFVDFLDQAEMLLSRGYHIPAASLTGAVLEDTLRKMCDQRNIAYPEKTNIDRLNMLLVKNGAYNKLKQKEITAKADIRNNADHGNFDQFNASDVKDMIGWVKRFVSDHLK